MVNPSDHTHDAGIIFLNHGMVHFVDAERIKSRFLILGRVDTAFDLSDLYLSHLYDYLPLNTFSTLMPRWRAT